MDIFVKPSLPLVKYLKVLMISVYENNKDVIEEEGITFWCLHNALEDSHKAEIKEISDRYNQKVEFIFVDVNIFNNLPSASPWPQTIYFGLLAHQFLPESVHRALYLDIDIAVNGNLKDFYYLPFDDNYLIASRDWYDARYEPEEEFKEFTYIDDIKEKEVLSNGIFNAGVILFNLDKLRKDEIDIEFYNKRMYGKTVRLADQSILSYCFSKKIKLLTTCKYNYRIPYSMVTLDQNRDNFYYNTFYHFNYYPIDARIIHYCGYKGFKPWVLSFVKGEIEVNKEFRDICPEYADYVGIWWKYAQQSPDYEELWDMQLRNKAAYSMVKSLFRNRTGDLTKKLYLDTLNVPDYFGRAAIRKGDDINRYVKPGIYACDAITKGAVKNLPLDFTTITNFRLTVKSLSIGPAYATSLVQILEIADKNATVYRRYTQNRENNWSPWIKIITSADMEQMRFVFDAFLNEIKNNDKGNEVFGLSRELEDVHNNVETLRSIQIESEKKFNDQLSALQAVVDSIVNSKSFKIGRFITFIPRKLRDVFKKK